MNIFHICAGSLAQNLLFLLMGIISTEIGAMEGMLLFIKYFIHLASIYSVPREPSLLQAPRTSNAQLNLWIKSLST